MPQFMAKTMKLNKLALITGSDIKFENQFLIHSPTILELSENNITENMFFKVLKLLTITKEDMEVQDEKINNLSNFHLLLGVIFNEKFPETDRIDFFNVLELLLKDYIISISENGFILNDKNKEENFYILDAENFNIFQKYIKKIFCMDKIFSSQQAKDEYNPAGERAKRIAEQLKQRHKTLAEKEEKKQDENISILANYMSILAIGIPCDICQLKNITIYQLYELLNRYSLYYNYDLDVRCKLAGSTDKSEVENWMKIQ